MTGESAIVAGKIINLEIPQSVTSKQKSVRSNNHILFNSLNVAQTHPNDTTHQCLYFPYSYSRQIEKTTVYIPALCSPNNF